MYTILLKQETPTNANATGTFASFWHVCETLIEALSCSLWDCFSDVKVPTATNATNETRQHGIAWNQTSLGLTNKHFQPKPDPSINKTPRWTSANQPQNSQSIRKALQKKTLSLHHWKDSHMKPNGVLHYDFNFFGLTLPLYKNSLSFPASQVCLCYMFVNEILEIISVIRNAETRWHRALLEDYLGFWNIVDWLSISVAAAVIAFWLGLAMESSDLQRHLGTLLEDPSTDVSTASTFFSKLLKSLRLEKNNFE